MGVCCTNSNILREKKSRMIIDREVEQFFNFEKLKNKLHFTGGTFPTEIIRY